MRFKPITEQNMSDAQREVFHEICNGPRGHLGPPSSVTIRSPELARHTQKVGEYIRFGSPLRGRIMEFVILIAARYWSSQYVWYAHYPLAIKDGLSVEVAADLAHGRRPSGMKDDEAAAYDFCTELTNTKEVSDAVFNNAIKHFGELGVVDLMGGSAYYTMQSMALKVNQAEVPNDGKVPPLPKLS